MKKSLCIETMFTDYDFYERFRLVREAGFDYLEFGVWTELDLQRVQDMQSEYLLHVASISGDRGHSLSAPEEREDFLEYLSQSIAVARSFKCRNLIIHSDVAAGAASAKAQGKSDFTRIAAATRALLDASKKAERAGVTLYLRPMPAPTQADGAVWLTPSAGDVVKVVNSTRLRLFYDTNGLGDYHDNALATLRKYREFIGYVHIGGDAADAAFTANLRRFRGVLVDELAYDGFVGFSLRGSDTDASLALIYDF